MLFSILSIFFFLSLTLSHSNHDDEYGDYKPDPCRMCKHRYRVCMDEGTIKISCRKYYQQCIVDYGCTRRPTEMDGTLEPTPTPVFPKFTPPPSPNTCFYNGADAVGIQGCACQLYVKMGGCPPELVTTEQIQEYLESNMNNFIYYNFADILYNNQDENNIQSRAEAIEDFTNQLVDSTIYTQDDDTQVCLFRVRYGPAVHTSATYNTPDNDGSCYIGYNDQPGTCTEGGIDNYIFKDFTSTDPPEVEITMFTQNGLDIGCLVVGETIL